MYGGLVRGPWVALLYREAALLTPRDTCEEMPRACLETCLPFQVGRTEGFSYQVWTGR